MSTIVVYGHSDDLIEIEGDIRNEFYALDEKDNFLVFSDGTVLQVVYNNRGCWDIRAVRKGTSEHSNVMHDNDKTTYSDRFTLRGDDLVAVGLTDTYDVR